MSSPFAEHTSLSHGGPVALKLYPYRTILHTLKGKKNRGKENCVNYIIIIMQTGEYFWENIMGEKIS